jgi:hypothetical protein
MINDNYIYDTRHDSYLKININESENNLNLELCFENKLQTVEEKTKLL